MKKALLSKFMAVLLVAVTVTAGCIESNDKDNEDDKESFHTTSSDFNIGMNEFVNSSNDFTFDMYKQLIFLDDNIFFSPYSISTALGMTYEGARGKTAAEILEVFDFPEDNQSRWDMVKDVQDTLNKEVTLYELSTANAYWLVEGGHLKQIYRDIIESYYLAHGEELDFAGDPEGSVEIINSWVENRTNNKIKDLLSINDIDGSTYLILTNAIYFKSDWKYQFDSKATDERNFTLSNKNHIKVDTMHMCDESKKLNYTSNSEVQLLQLPYKDDELSMYILLPIDNDITSIETELSFN
jgi:serpin B